MHATYFTIEENIIYFFAYVLVVNKKNMYQPPSHSLWMTWEVLHHFFVLVPIYWVLPLRPDFSLEFRPFKKDVEDSLGYFGRK